ncbi:hypothetical protein K435DRAFT_797186 [Dendrothele bispora CBS 962.96]|uniref:Uncharacterized protein n=1 Tax=Dendrothele bispora (strain CBS 962.96) TaxID=1314807 RepID=A0A4V4HFY1_DENBC|nr:hypothetical protein K435DRAFT_797186 [Dendrothele bispora CBS 962.96]
MSMDNQPLSDRVKTEVKSIKDQLDELKLEVTHQVDVDLKETIIKFCDSFSTLVGVYCSPERLIREDSDLWKIFIESISVIDKDLHELTNMQYQMPGSWPPERGQRNRNGVLDSAIATASHIHLNCNYSGARTTYHFQSQLS